VTGLISLALTPWPIDAQPVASTTVIPSTTVSNAARVISFKNAPEQLGIPLHDYPGATPLRALGLSAEMSVVRLDRHAKRKRALESSPKATKGKKQSGENDLEQQPQAHSKQPECWSRCSVRSAQAR
jgi:hypothetical protein